MVILLGRRAGSPKSWQYDVIELYSVFFMYSGDLSNSAGIKLLISREGRKEKEKPLSGLS